MSCNIVRLCGITSRFQLLSPSTRQVTHALLTRPPLSHKELQTEVICSKCFVRLACVKHAASVHPEPGSNSYVKVLFRPDSLANSGFSKPAKSSSLSRQFALSFRFAKTAPFFAIQRLPQPSVTWSRFIISSELL